MAATSQNSSHRRIESYIPAIRLQNGIYTNLPIVANGSITNTGVLNPSNIDISNTINSHNALNAVNATATLTAAQVASGYITSTSAAAVTMTLPTGTLLGAAINATQGTVLKLYIDNTAGANTITLAAATNGVLSAAGVAGSSANFGLLTVPSGVTGIAQFTLVFSSATAYVFTRTA